MKLKNSIVPLHKKPSESQKPNFTQSISIGSKRNSQFPKYKSSKTSKERTHFASTSLKFNGIDTTKKLISHSESIDYENIILDLKNQIEKLNTKLKTQKRFIDKLVKENQKLDQELINIKEIKNTVQRKYDSLKENQEQLIMLLKILEKNGIDLESVIDHWNEMVEEETENIKEKNLNRENDSNINNNNNNNISLNNSGDSFLPLTLVGIIKEEKKIEVPKGIPKLKFDNISNGKIRKREQNNNRKRNVTHSLIGNTYHSYSSDDKIKCINK